MAKQMTETTANNGHTDAKPAEVMTSTTPATLIPKKIEVDVEKIKQFGKDNPLKVIGTTFMLIAALIWFFCPRTPSYPAAGYQPAAFSAVGYAPAAVGPAPQVAASGPAFTPSYTKLAANQQLTFVVASVGNMGGSKFLNSSVDYKAAGNQSILLSGAAAGLNAQMMVGRTVTATGELRQSAKGQTYLLVTNPQAVLVK